MSNAGKRTPTMQQTFNSFELLQPDSGNSATKPDSIIAIPDGTATTTIITTTATIAATTTIESGVSIVFGA
jgi:hypothetical protein